VALDKERKKENKCSFVFPPAKRRHRELRRYPAARHQGGTQQLNSLRWRAWGLAGSSHRVVGTHVYERFVSFPALNALGVEVQLTFYNHDTTLLQQQRIKVSLKCPSSLDRARTCSWTNRSVALSGNPQPHRLLWRQ